MQLLPLQLPLHPTPAGGKPLRGQGGLVERSTGGGRGAENRRVGGEGNGGGGKQWPAAEGQQGKGPCESGH